MNSCPAFSTAFLNLRQIHSLFNSPIIALHIALKNTLFYSLYKTIQNTSKLPQTISDNKI